MNGLLPTSGPEITHRLALGIEPIDAVSGGRVATPVRVELEGGSPWRPARSGASYRTYVAPGAVRPATSRHDSGRYALLAHAALSGSAEVRVYDHSRRFVPRRLRVPVLSPEDAERSPFTHRIRRPWLFPGAGYDVIERSTGLRGRVLRDGQPMRWFRVEARLASGVRVGRAFGDDRGEFLLLLTCDAEADGELHDPLEVEVIISGPAVAPVSAFAAQREQDPWWDLPIEDVPDAGLPDLVSMGDRDPDGYVTASASPRTVRFERGRILSRINPADGSVVVEDFDFTV